MDLSENVQSLPGIGARRAQLLRRLGIVTAQDLLSHFPRRYEDRRAVREIAELADGEYACVTAFVAAPPSVTHIRDSMNLLRLNVMDSSGVLNVTFFNQLWRRNELHTGTAYVFYGKAELTGRRRSMTNPVVERADSQEATGRIVPVYPLTAGVSQWTLRHCVEAALRSCADALTDSLPEEIRRQYELPSAKFAYWNIHFPNDMEALEASRRRLAFEELFLLSVGLQSSRKRRESASAEAFAAVDMSPFYDALPFSLTNAQRRCIDEALSDMRSSVPMSRLCQGDVGSGKTMVAAACAYFCVKNGRQAVLMAPTEILARQHFDGLSALLGPLGIRSALLTGSASAKEKRAVREGAAVHELDFVIGTHALISDGVTFADLGLVVTDEQHRFGVAQRAALTGKGTRPHTLLMSATPIPRTLALAVYGDLDVSFLDELPPGRVKVKTYAVSGDYRPRIYAFLEKLMSDGGQIYIVCPMVGDADDIPDDRKAVTEYAGELRTRFPNRRILSVHGRMKSKDKERVMTAFASGEADMLVSTTVIEVGVDVPNAVAMVVENAERFGLSQLHQLRGRVGRGGKQSYCVLISDAPADETRERLRVMVNTSDGFRVAEEDLRIRGPGDFFGERQHGLPPLKVAALSDAALLEEARTAAASLLDQDPDLSQHPLTAQSAESLLQSGGAA